MHARVEKRCPNGKVCNLFCTLGSYGELLKMQILNLNQVMHIRYDDSLDIVMVVN